MSLLLAWLSPSASWLLCGGVKAGSWGCRTPTLAAPGQWLGFVFSLQASAAPHTESMKLGTLRPGSGAHEKAFLTHK